MYARITIHKDAEFINVDFGIHPFEISNHRYCWVPLHIDNPIQFMDKFKLLIIFCVNCLCQCDFYIVPNVWIFILRKNVILFLE